MNMPRPSRPVQRWLSQLRRLLRDRRGGPAMEFAVIAPILLACMIAVFDLGSALQQRIRLAEAVRAGGLYAVSYPTTGGSNALNTTAIANAVTNAVPDWTDLTVATPTETCICWNQSTSVSTNQSCTPSLTCASGSELLARSRPIRNFLCSMSQSPRSMSPCSPRS